MDDNVTDDNKQQSEVPASGVFSSSFDPNKGNELISRQVKARIEQQRLAKEYARKRLEDTYSSTRHPLQEKLDDPTARINNSQPVEEESVDDEPSTKVWQPVKSAQELRENQQAAESGEDDQPVDEDLKLRSGRIDNNESNSSGDAQSDDQQNLSLSDQLKGGNTHYQRSGGPSDFNAKKYHTAWQNYYKNYFGRYYQSYYQNYHQQLGEHRERLQAQMKLLEQKAKNGTATTEEMDEIDRIKKEIVDNVKLKARKVRQHRHFLPTLAAVSVLLFLIFFQYNPIIVGAAKQYIKPSDSASIPTIVAPGSDTQISQDPTISIPKIGVQAPVIYDIKGLYDADVQPALENGVVRYNFPGNVYPGEVGNVVLIGHSSNNVFNPGKYNYIFVNLNKLTVDDIVSVNYQGVKYTYKVTATEVVSPQEFKYIEAVQDKSVLTLMTCSPPGTNISRLFVRAEQISPDPANNSSAEDSDGSISDDGSGQSPTETPATTSNNNTLPGTAPSVWERLFGGLFGRN